ncbi:hypothetical protein BH11PSE12_BH11PSE12_02790 [soil metagenome]
MLIGSLSLATHEKRDKKYALLAPLPGRFGWRFSSLGNTLHVADECRRINASATDR